LTTHIMDEADSLCGRVAIMHHGKVVATGSPAELKASIDGAGKTLDDVFIYYTGDEIDSGGNFRETRQSRRTARRLG
jgi:ABC-2 type transport system ATP-binding protein